MRRFGLYLRMFLFLAIAISFLVVPSAEAKYPDKPIKVLLALGAGGSHDLHARAVASVIHEYVGQPMVVQLMPGAGGKIAMTALKRAKPDGYTVMLASSSHITISPHVREMGYDPLKDFIPIFQVNYGIYMLATMTNKPWKNLDEFVAAAKKSPGKVSYGSSGVYGTGHLMVLKLMADKGMKLNVVPFKGGGPAVRAMLGGHVDSSGGNPSTGGIADNVRAGKVRILAVAGEKRIPQFPKAPTFQEKGVDFILESWRTFIVPKGTPQDRIEILVEALKKVSKNKTFKRILSKMNERPQPLWGKALRERIRKQYEAFGKVFASAGITKKKK